MSTSTSVTNHTTSDHTATARTHYPALDGARAIGALLVLLTHVGFRTGQSLDGSLFGAIMARGNFGVTLFFVLSGFLLYRPFAAYGLGGGAKPKVGGYFRRRAARILPALWLMIVIVLTFSVTTKATFRDYYSYLLLIQVYNHNDTRHDLSHLWSLSAEVAFYALLPVLAWVFARRAADRVTAARQQLVGVGFVIAGGYLFSLVRGAGAIPHPQAALWLPSFIPWFGLGMLLAILSLLREDDAIVRRPRRLLRQWAQSLWTCWFVAVAFYLLATTPIGTPYDLTPATSGQFITQNTLFGLCAFFFLLPLVMAVHERADKFLGTGVGKFLGDISYSVYLWHVVSMLWVEKMLGSTVFGGRFWEVLAGTTLVAIAISSASWLLVEKPALRYFAGRRHRKAKKPVTASAA